MKTVTTVSIADLELYETPGFGREGSSGGKAFPLDTGVPGIILELSWRRYDKGYGTPRHLKALAAYGPCAEHRKTYQPVKGNLLPLFQALDSL